MFSSDVEVHVMPTRVRIARLLQEARSGDRKGYALLDIIGPVLKSLIGTENRDTFFELILDCAPPTESEIHPNGNGVAESADEAKRVEVEPGPWRPAISLLLDEDSVGNFRADSLETFKDAWRPIKILEASGGVATDQLVAILRPLSKSRISIMNISTFNDDFLLCDDDRADEVVQSISGDDAPLSPSLVREVHDGAFVWLMPQQFVMLHHLADAMHEFTPSIMHVLLACADGDVDHGFVSVTRIAEEVTWILPRDLFDKFEASALTTCIGDYRALQLRGSFSEHSNGVVDAFCAPLADAECEVLSMSSYWTNTMLVREEDVDMVVEKLKSSGFRVEAGTARSGDSGIRSPLGGGGDDVRLPAIAARCSNRPHEHVHSHDSLGILYGKFLQRLSSFIHCHEGVTVEKQFFAQPIASLLVAVVVLLLPATPSPNTKPFYCQYF